MAAAQTVQDVFQRVTSIDPATIRGVTGVMLFNLGGEGGGKWTVRFADGAVTLEEGEANAPDVTFTMAAQDFIAIANGQLNPISAFMQGKVKVSGDMALAMRLQSILTS